MYYFFSDCANLWNLCFSLLFEGCNQTYTVYTSTRKPTMTIAAFALSFLACLLLLLGSVPVRSEVVLSEKIMKLSRQAAVLSSQAYLPNPEADFCKSIINHIEEPDQALVAETEDGYCIAAFRGTTLTAVDWSQNLDPRSEEICTAQDPTLCCGTRKGFYDAYSTSYESELETQLRECAAKCDDPNECVILTGHSQGGAVAAIAAVHLADLNPRVITFGEPSTLAFPCEAITTHQWYRYVNLKDSFIGTISVSYDPVAFVPGMGTQQWGNFILLGADSTAIAFVGLDDNTQFSPLNVAGFEAHSMIGTEEYPGYLDRIESLIDYATNGTFPVRANGFSPLQHCTQDIECETKQCEKETTFSYRTCVSDECVDDEDCLTGRCDSGHCLPKLGSGMGCDEDSDCASEKCYLFQCTNMDGLMDDECTCVLNSDCDSGRCEGVASRTCRAALGLGAKCNEHSDCISDYCSWGFICEDKARSISRVEWTVAKAVLIALSIFGVVTYVKKKAKAREGYELVV